MPHAASFVAYDDQYEKLNSIMQVAWTGTMEKGNYTTSHSYNEVHVLLLSWESEFDDLKVKDEVTALEAVFRDIYNYHVQSSPIKTRTFKKAQTQVNKIVASWVDECDAPKTLLIVYFAGHGRPGNKPGSLEIAGNSSPNDVRQHLDKVIWNRTETNLQDTHADVLQVFDCCYAGTLGTDRGGTRVFEYLAATSADATTKCPGPRSFTTALIWALKHLASTRGRFTTSDLLNTIKDHAPEFPRDQKPILSKRYDHSAELIILEPRGVNHVSVQIPDELPHHDISKQDILVLKFILETRPSVDDIKSFGGDLNTILLKKGLHVSRIIWGGLRPRQNIVHQAAHEFLRSIGRRKSERLGKLETSAALAAVALAKQVQEQVSGEVMEQVNEHLHDQVHEQVHEEVQHEFESHSTTRRSSARPR
ncbi:hypothetical protein MMC15_003626 [Xylographa vitiligo]|nr:hypothetical protein [Xylographa vitiligo]